MSSKSKLVECLIVTAAFVWDVVTAIGLAFARTARRFAAWLGAVVVGFSVAVGSALASVNSTKALTRLHDETVTLISTRSLRS